MLPVLPSKSSICDILPHIIPQDQHIKVKRLARLAILQVHRIHKCTAFLLHPVLASPEHSLCSDLFNSPHSHGIGILSYPFFEETMGQYWQVVCPSKREYTTQLFGGKLSELLFSSWANILCDLIEHEWAGTRLICIGDYLNPDHLPATIQQDNLHLISAESDATSKPLRYDVVEEEFELWSYEEEEEAATLTAMEESVNPKIRVLGNLTTSQYVFKDKLPSGITLGHIVLMRICWSSDSSTSIAGGGYLAEGVWAGHKFDIVDVDTLEDMDGQWEDVTEDIRDEIQVLWSSDFGYNWETEWRA